MPLVKIEIVKGHSEEYKHTLMDALHQAMVTILQTPEGDRYQRLYEIEEQYFKRAPSKTNKFVLIEVNLFPGRSKDIKRNLIFEIVRLLGERLEIAPSDIFIVLHDPHLDNWGQRGDQVSELGVTYKVQ